MLKIPFEIKNNYSFISSRQERCAYNGQMPAPELKRGYRPFTLCASSTDAFFDIPKSAIDVQAVLTKRPHPDAYELKHTKGTWGYRKVTLDGFDTGGMYTSAYTAIKKAIALGYTHVRFTYKEQL
jgi:hypothetical protein